MGGSALEASAGAVGVRDQPPMDDGVRAESQQAVGEGVGRCVQLVVGERVEGVEDEDGAAGVGGDAGTDPLPPVPAAAGDAVLVAPDDLAGLRVFDDGIAAGGGVEGLAT